MRRAGTLANDDQREGVRPSRPGDGGRKDDEPKVDRPNGERPGDGGGKDDPPDRRPDDRPPEFEYLVRGQVLYRHGLPILGREVRAFHVMLRRDVEIGSARTDDAGNYEIYFNVADIPGGRPDLQTRVYDEDGETVLGESRVRFSAGQITKLRIQVEGGAERVWSEYDQLMAEMAPVLEDAGVDTLDEDEVILLAGKTAQPAERVAALVVAHKLAGRTGVAPEIFYGLARENVATNLSSLLAAGPEVRRAALESAVRSRVVPGRLLDEIEGVETQVRSAVIDRAASGEAPGSLGATLADVLPDEERRQEFIARYSEHEGTAEEFWTELRNSPAFSERVDDLQIGVQLMAISGAHEPLVRTLLARRGEQFSSISELAALDESDWEAIIRSLPEGQLAPPSIPGNDETKVSLYTQTLRRVVADAMPTESIAYAHARDDAKPDDVRQFWTNVTQVAAEGPLDWQLGTADFTERLAGDPRLMEGVSDQEALTFSLQQTQRVFNLTTDAAEIDMLMASGISSADDVVRLGNGVFMQRFAPEFTYNRAQLIYDKAEHVAATKMSIAGRVHPQYNQVPLGVLKAVDPKDIPSLRTLFGSFDMCLCGHCRSISGPSAYLAEVLSFLRERRLAGSTRTALDVLFARRPDLGELELTCANSDTVMPFIDLVNEVLERVVAPFQPFNVPQQRAAELDARTISDSLRSAFTSAGHSLSADHFVLVITPGQHWLLTDHSVLYVVKHEGAALQVQSSTYQSGAPAPQLAAHPEHVWAPAYTALREAVFPWNLPLDLWREEVVTYLEHLGVRREALMEEFSALAHWGAMSDVGIAAERLGFSAKRRQIATGTLAGKKTWDFYGLKESANAVEVVDPANPATPKNVSLTWIQTLSWVEQLVMRAQITYEELVTLLTTRFVNPNGTVRIVSADPADLTSCALHKLRLEGADGAMFARMHRFVVTWRQLGWDPYELDRAIGTLGRNIASVDARLDNATLLGLGHVARLRDRLRLGVTELLAMWAPISVRDTVADAKDSPYLRLFQNPSVMNPPDPRFALKNGDVAVRVNTPAEAKISKHAGVILAAFEITAADLEALAPASDELSLKTLSRIYRHVLLARGLGLTPDDLLALLQLTGLDPFAGEPQHTTALVELADAVRGANLSVAELDYLLNHGSAERVEWAPLEADLAAALDGLRVALGKVHEETAPRPEPTGDLTRSLLAQLRWPADLVTRAVDTIAGTAEYRAALAAMPAGAEIPQELSDRVSYDEAASELVATGPLSDDDRIALHGVSADATYRAAVDELFAQPRDFVNRRMRAFEFPTFSTALAALPAGVTIPGSLRRRVYHDPVAGRLRVDGALGDADKALLDAQSNNAGYRAGVQALYEQPATYAPPPGNDFYATAGATELFDEQLTPAQRFELVSGRVLKYLRAVAAQRTAIEHVAALLGVGTRDAHQLLTEAVHADGSNTEWALGDFVADAFATSNAGIAVTPAAWPALFRTATRLVKTARLAEALALSPSQAAWIATFAAGVQQRDVPWLPGATTAGWLTPDALPVTPSAASPARFAAWTRLADLVALRDRLPGGFTSLTAVLTAARTATGSPTDMRTAVLDAIATATGWDRAQVDAVVTRLGLTLPADAADETGLTRVERAIRRMRRLGATADQCAAFAAAEPTEADGKQARQLVKAKYPEAEWPEIARPLRDALRERQREALVGYLLHRADPAKGQRWADAAGMYQHFLIDVEMSACAMTSRIKQAMGSVQQFVQRCLLNLEPEVSADSKTDAGWKDWKWMKNYRVWEANRKVFMHPENWLEPELRDDKSPLFRAAEGELLQDDVTAEVAEDVFLRYLHGLDQVARLEIAGVYLQPAAEGQPEVLHVFGRTHGSTTPQHYYRRRVGARWTAWEVVDLDITERQLLPIVWNRRLLLFWPVFTERNLPNYGDKPTPPGRRFDIQLAWSELRRGKWSQKRITPNKVESMVIPDDSPDRGKGRHVLRAGIDVQGLKVWYEFDDPPQPQWVPGPYGSGYWTGGAYVGGWLFTGAEGKIEPLSQLISGIYQPSGTYVDGMDFTESGWSPLNLPKIDATGEAVALSNTPGVFSLSYLHQDRYITGLHPFFYADDARTYFVESVERSLPVMKWPYRDILEIAVVDDIRRYYYEPVIVRDPDVIDPIGPITQFGVTDPVPVARAVIGRAVGYRNAHGHLGITSATPMPTLKPGSLDPTLDLARETTLFMPSEQRVLERSREVGEPVTLRRSSPTKELPARTRFIVAKGDKQVVSISDYIDDARIVKDVYRVPLTQRVRRYRFSTFFHPYTTAFMRSLSANGIDGLLERGTQLQRAQTFKARYAPTDAVLVDAKVSPDGYPAEDVDFSFGGAYSIYNWELFFHLPLLIATRLTQNQRFEEAQRWLHFIFDPTDTSDPVAPRRYWRTRPFYEETQAEVQAQRIEAIIKELADGVVDADLKAQVDEWRRNPFKPHAIARLRITAYQMNVVMRYLDNIIAWADQLFRRDTIESINEATQLYVLAVEILGRRPNVMPPRAEPQVRTYNTLRPELSAFSDAMVDIEYLFGSSRPDSVVHDPTTPPLPLPEMLYFCVPANDKLLRYWDTVEDRLFKIRHCMNIEGVVRQLPLFEPPIDPALLVRAAAAGVDISTALSDAGAPLPIYRFMPILNRAKAFAADVSKLGGALLQALESRDAERLALLRSTNEIALQESVAAVRRDQVREATQQIATQRKARETAVARYLHYQKLLGNNAQRPAEGAVIPEVSPTAGFRIVSESGAKLIQQEKDELTELSYANESQEVAAGWEMAASLANMIPTFSVAIKPWGIGMGMSFGGANVAAAASAVAGYWRSESFIASNAATRAGRLGQYVLREHEWALQANLAAREIVHIDAQTIAATIRKELAEKELAAHDMRTENAMTEHELMTSKYTNEELKIWMIGRISEVYFQAYRLAYDVAKRAERAYGFELGLTDASFIQFGYWDNLRKGLLSGDRLMLDLHRLEASYLEQNRREHELVKHVSVNLLHPEALVELRETGSCIVEMPEAILDLDHPGHYMRRIKSVSVSMPCTAGPYTSVSCKLTLLSNRVRRNASLAPQYRWQGPEDTRFTYDPGGVDSIVTSTAREDSGLFSLNFGDERYLPFEGAGAISAWRLELPAQFRQFDYGTITDVVLRVSYTARDGGATLQTAATKDLADALKRMEVGPGTAGPTRMFSARIDFPDALAALLHPLPTATKQALAFELGKDRFPAYARDRTIKLVAMAVFVKLRPGFDYDSADPIVVTVKPPGSAPASDVTLDTSPANAGGLPAGLLGFPGVGLTLGASTGWSVTFKEIPAALGEDVEVDGDTIRRLNPEALADVGLLFGFTV